jgi:hypothetical protein
MPQHPKGQTGQPPRNPPGSPEASPSDVVSTKSPPQGAGVELKPFAYGAPPRFVKYGVAIKVLADPVARNTFSQPYSGQRRFWKG